MSQKYINTVPVGSIKQLIADIEAAAIAPWEPEQMTAAAAWRGWRFRKRWTPAPPRGDA